MTYQTSPYLPWIFPDQAYNMNDKGKHYVASPPVKGLDLMDGEGFPEQVDFNSWEKKVAMDSVMNTRRAKAGMEGRLNTTARSQRYDRPASRSAVPNGVFNGSPMEYVTSAGLRGGVITTKEGQEWLSKRLLQRQEEYGELASGNFSAGPPKHINVSRYNGVDTLLQSLFTDFGSGSFSSKVNENLNQLLSQFIMIGAELTPNQLGNYARAVGKLRETTRPYLGREMGENLGFAYEGREKRFRALDSINATLKLIESVLKEIARTIYESQPAREQVMSTLRERLLGRQIETFQPGFAGEERRGAVEDPFRPELGGPPQLGRPSGELFPSESQTYIPLSEDQLGREQAARQGWESAEAAEAARGLGPLPGPDAGLAPPAPLRAPPRVPNIPPIFERSVGMGRRRLGFAPF